jgi:squalene synthase HpnC
MAVYGFARLVDDIGDEVPGDRAALLDHVDAEIDRIYAGTPELPLLRRLADTVHDHDIPPEPLRRLVEANRQDQQVRRYATYDDLRRYCTLSANPVGELVLYVFGRPEPQLIALSDRICTALQLTEHWQDVAEDLARGRIYLPTEDLEAWNCTAHDLAAPSASARVRRLMAFEVSRARRLLDDGTPLVGRLSGLARVAVAGYVAGGRAALRAIVDAEFDVLSGTPRPARPVVLAEWLRLAAGGGRR